MAELWLRNPAAATNERVTTINPLPTRNVDSNGNFVSSADTVGEPVFTSVSLTTTALSQLPNLTARTVAIQSDPDNTIDILVGDAASQPIQLGPGEAWSFAIPNANRLYAKNVSTGTQTLGIVAVV